MTSSPFWKDMFMTGLLKPDPLHIPPPLVATGPLGLCYQCCTTRAKDPAHQVSEAITLAPTSVQIGDALGNTIGIQIIALPHCMACLSGTGSKLITA